jgi:hypothetical protein
LKKIQIIGALFLAISLLAAGCKASAPETTPTTDPNAVMTAAAETANARLTEIIASTPSPLPATDTPTPQPATATPPATTAAPTLAATATSGVSTGVDKADYVSDISIPDGTNLSPGETFVKTWRIVNSGTSTWTTAYALTYISGAQMGGPAKVSLTTEVAPGKTVDISVNMTAPTAAGQHIGYWKMSNASGALFDTPVYVDINVTGTASSRATVTATSDGAATPAATATSSTGSGVSAVSLTVDEASYTGTCPHTFVFTAQITLNQATSVTYELEVSTGFEITLPPPVTTTLNAGTTVLPYQLEFTNGLTGTAVMHVSSPVNLNSNLVTFTLNCQ